MISLKDYLMGREEEYPLTKDLLLNAAETVRRANELLNAFGKHRSVTSGYRPPAINAVTPGASKKSKHMLCLAVDLEDGDSALDAWCLANEHKLEEIGLWLENPNMTPGWTHVQIIPPKSGRRVFNP